MPDMLAHYDVAEAARARLAAGPLARLIAEAPDAYAVGAQGPDFLFYAQLWPDGRGRNDLAHRLHHQGVSDTVTSMLELAAAAPPADQATLYAYACGYAAHVCLDSCAHPWVLYWTGDISRGVTTPEEAVAMRRHGVLEASVDVALVARHQPSRFSWPRSVRLLSLLPSRRRAVSALWERVLRDVHGVEFAAGATSSALLAMAAVYGLMTDRRSPLSLLLRAGGPKLDPDGIARTQVYPAAPHPAAMDLLTSRRVWCSPWRPDERRRETFAELFDGAAAETLACLQAIETAAFGGSIAGVLAVIADRDLLSGERCGDPRPAVAFAPDRDRLWDGC
jgi:Zinc dependent phospholipase C